VAYRGLGRPERAIEDYDEVLRTAPDDAITYMNRANAYYYLGDPRRAIEDYDQAVARAGEDSPWLYMILENRGQSYAKLGDYQRAIEDYDESIRLDPYYAIAYNDRGAAYNALGDETRALQEYDQAIALDPNYALPYRNRAWIYMRRGDYRGAIENFSRNIEITETDPFGHLGLGIAHYCLDEFDKSTEDMAKALSLEPEFPYYGLWFFLAGAREHAQASAQAELGRQAAEFDLAEWPGPLVNLYLGESEADTAAAKAKNDEQKCEADFYIGALLALDGDTAAAVPLLQRALERCPREFVEVPGASCELARLGIAAD
jgi:tetratricopeptide (TPR) repeat protein